MCRQTKGRPDEVTISGTHLRPNFQSCFCLDQRNFCGFTMFLQPSSPLPPGDFDHNPLHHHHHFHHDDRKENQVSKVFLPPAPDILSGKNCSSCHCLPLPSDHHHHLPLNRHRNHVCKIGGSGNWHRTAIITRSVSSTGWFEKPQTQTEVSNLFQNICQHCIKFLCRMLIAHPHNIP